MADESNHEAPFADELGSDASDDGGSERDICVVRPAMFRAHPLKYLLIVILFLAGLGLDVMAFVKAPEGASFSKWMLGLGLVLSLFAAGWWVKWWLGSTIWIRLAITNKRTVRHEGIVRRHSTEVLHDHVRSVDIQQTFLQRIFNVGYLGIDTAGQDGIEIEVRDIPAPYDVKKIIDRHRAM